MKIHLRVPGAGTECGKSLHVSSARFALAFSEGDLEWKDCCKACLKELNAQRAMGGLGAVQDEPCGLTLEQSKAFWSQRTA